MQENYDFSVRSFRTVLEAAGAFRMTLSEIGADTEQRVIARAVRTANAGKLKGSDLKIFNDLLLTIFPGEVVDKDEIWADVLDTQAIEIATERLDFQPDPQLLSATRALAEALVFRVGVAVVGNTGSGKTVARQVLQLARASDAHGARDAAHLLVACARCAVGAVQRGLECQSQP